MKKINTLIIALISVISSLSFASTEYLEIAKPELLPSHFESLISKSLKSDKALEDLYYKTLTENDCHVTAQGHVVNCSIPIEVSHSNVVILSYLTTVDLIGNYRVHLYILNQGTQIWNSIALSLDFKFEEYGNAYRLKLTSFKKGY